MDKSRHNEFMLLTMIIAVLLIAQILVFIPMHSEGKQCTIDVVGEITEIEIVQYNKYGPSYEKWITPVIKYVYDNKEFISSPRIFNNDLLGDRKVGDKIEIRLDKNDYEHIFVKDNTFNKIWNYFFLIVVITLWIVGLIDFMMSSRTEKLIRQLKENKDTLK